MANKTSVSSTINCTISDSDVYTTLFTPDISKIGSNNSQSYTVYEYLNGVKTDTTFSIVCSNAPQKCYIATIDTNSITIQALRISSLPLIITYTNNRTSESKTFNIELGGIS